MTDLAGIKNFVQLTPDVGTSGQPKREQFALIKQEGYAGVVNLALPTSDHAIADEGSVVTGLGMSYFHIPVEFTKPTVEDLRTFFGAMHAFQGKESLGALRRQRARVGVHVPLSEARARRRRRGRALPRAESLGADDGLGVEGLHRARSESDRRLSAKIIRCAAAGARSTSCRVRRDPAPARCCNRCVRRDAGSIRCLC